MDLETTILLGYSAVCHITETYRQDRTAKLSDERDNADELMHLVFLFNVIVVSKKHQMTATKLSSTSIHRFSGKSD
jgi:hypothetical protein